MDNNKNFIRSIFINIFAILTFIVLIISTLPHENAAKWTYDVNRPWKYDDLFSSFEFPIIKDTLEIKREKDSLLRSYEPYYILDKYTDDNHIAVFNREQAQATDALPAHIARHLKILLQAVYDQGILDNAEFQTIAQDTNACIRIIEGKEVSPVRIKHILSPIMAYEKIVQDPLVQKHKAIMQNIRLEDYLKPNLKYDDIRNKEELRSLEKSITIYSGIFPGDGTRIVSRGEIVTKRTFQIIMSYEEAKNQHTNSVKSIPAVLGGQALYVVMMFLLLLIYLILFRRDYFENTRKLMLLYFLISIFPIIVSLMIKHSLFSIYVIPFTVVPMFIRVFMDSRTAFLTHVLMIMICSVAVKYPYEFLIVQIVAGAVAVYSMRHLTRRSEIFIAAFYITLASVLIYFALQLIQDQPTGVLDLNIIKYICVNGVLLLFAYPTMYILEKLFQFTSDVTLIELSNTYTSKLLKHMSKVAPGTSQHCITVSNLCADIADELGAETLLVRTAALYHDIGKTVHPENFTENQKANMNPLASKTPEEAAKIIISHVETGIQLAKKHKLPEEIIDFIRTHHGRSLTKYFYINYKNEHPGEEIDTAPFTYSGPNPQTREQAILMMTDAVEAASRSLNEYTEENITRLVNNIIDQQVADKLFAECPINFKDIHIAKQVLIKSLMSIYHTRIAYPKEK